MKLTLGGGSIPVGSKSDGAPTPLGFGCLFLFLLPFASTGLITAVMAVLRISAGNWREAAFFSLFAIVFGGVGLGGMSLVLVGWKRMKQEAALKARHPDQPWLWQKDWAARQIPDTSHRILWTSWVFAIIWNLISIPTGILGVRAAIQENKPEAFMALLFPLVGAGLLTWAIRTTLRYRKYGVSRFDLSTLPGVIGHTLAGTVRTTSSVQPSEGFMATLTCVRRVVRGRGDNRSTNETILWQEERTVRGRLVRDVGGYATQVPVKFRIPPDAEASDASDPNNQVVWRLKLSGKVPGVDYESLFEVPVFRTAASDRPLTAEELDEPEEEIYQRPAHSRIRVTANRRGTEIVFPAARNVGAALGATVFTLLWGGLVWALLHFGAPIGFAIVFGLLGLLMVYSTLQLWLGVSQVTVDAGAVTVAHGWLIPGRERRLPASDIAEVSTAIGMRNGSTPYYDVVLVRKDAKKLIAGRAVRDKREAEWLAAAIRDALGHRPESGATRLAS